MTTATDPYARLRERIHRQHPTTWRPDPGDVLVGEFVRLDAATTRTGEDVNIAVVRDDEGTERGVWLLHTALREQLAKARPKPGEPVAFLYEGERQSATGRRYHAWRVEVEREAAPDWDSLADDEAAESPRPDDDLPF